MQIGLSGRMFDAQSIWDHLEAAVDAGYKSVELSSAHVHPGLTEKEVQQINDYLQKNSITVSGLHCFAGNYGLLKPEDAEAAFEDFCRYVLLAEKLHAAAVTVWPAWVSSGEADEGIWAQAACWLRKSADFAAEHGVRPVVEIHHGTLCDTAVSALKLLTMAERENLGLALNPASLYQLREDYVDAAEKLSKHICNVHIRDIVRLERGENPGCFAYGQYAERIGRFTPVRYTPGTQKEYYVHRRINQGGIDWRSVLAALQKAGYDGPLTVDSVAEGAPDMPSGRNLARACYDDVKTVLGMGKSNANWHKFSVKEPGMYHVVAAGRDETQVAEMFRLNLPQGETYTLNSGALEMNALVTAGKITVCGSGLEDELEHLDSFYIPGDQSVLITAKEDCSLYIGAAPCEGCGKAFIRKMDWSLPIGDVHQIHGEGSGQREVMFTLTPQDAASRLICGVTWGGDGTWTSWIPHQHEKDLEEVYCYFDFEEGQHGLHYSYNTDETFRNATSYVVGNGSMVIAPKGYHPTCGIPGYKNTYFWVLAAHSHTSRRYDLAITDPNL